MITLERLLLQGDDYTTRCLIDYPNFIKYYKLIAVDLNKQQKLDADPKEIQQINFTENVTSEEGARMYFVTEEAKKKVLDFSEGSIKLL